jgi:hypothetical protein
LKNKETEEVYRHKREILSQLETLSEQGLIDLYYGDESKVSLEPCVRYAWQFADEEVALLSRPQTLSHWVGEFLS